MKYTKENTQKYIEKSIVLHGNWNYTIDVDIKQPYSEGLLGTFSVLNKGRRSKYIGTGGLFGFNEITKIRLSKRKKLLIPTTK